MTENPEKPGGRPRPTPRARTNGPARPTPRPRVAGTRRGRDDAALTSTADVTTETSARPASTARLRNPRPAGSPSAGGPGADAGTSTGARTRRRVPALALTLALLCLVAAAGVGLLLWQRLNPTTVNPELFAAARDGVEALYGYDYEDSEGSVQAKLDVATGDLREQYEQTWQGAIIDQYEQASATSRFDVLDVGLQQVNEAQDTATLVVFGAHVVQSTNTGTTPAPPDSGCEVTAEGASSCVDTLRVTVVRVDGEWKISEAIRLTTP